MMWKTDFGFDDVDSTKPPRVEKNKAKKMKLSSESSEDVEIINEFKVPNPLSKKMSNISWVDKYEPKNYSELIIHCKKLEELENALKKSDEKILLITGPSGSGKTCSLKCVCKKLNIGIKEWITSVNKITTDYDMEYSDRDLYTNNITLEFEQFLLKTNRKRVINNYNRDIVLIKDIPNIFLNDGSLLHEVIEKYNTTMKNTLVFIFNDEDVIYKLFPLNILNKYKINNIKFNPINDTGLIKTLEKILKNENININNDIIINIIQNCNGNLSYAINQLYFYTIKKDNIKQKYTKLTTKILKESKQIKNKNLDKCKQINYFQTIGRILYPKKELINSDQFYKLKNKNMCYNKNDLFKYKYNPNELVNEFITQPNKTINILQENYISKVNNIKDLVNITNAFSQIDTLYNYNYKAISQEIQLQIMIRNIMSNDSVNTSYTQIQKTNKYLIQDQNDVNKNVHNLFHDIFVHDSSLNILFDNLSIIKGCDNYMNIKMNPHQIKFIQDNQFK